MNNGDLAGMLNDESLVKYPSLFFRTLEIDEKYPNGESPIEFYNRIKDWFYKANDNDVFTWSVFLKTNYTLSGKEEVIGQVSAQENGENISIRDVGWFIDPKYQGNGYAKVKIKKISSGAVKENIPSCKIFEKLGFRKIE